MVDNRPSIEIRTSGNESIIDNTNSNYSTSSLNDSMSSISSASINYVAIVHTI